ncbi:MAG: hypothetical protein K2L07_13125 [Lachnospiraceae bacterium]|nr:hypothetical protein [Lachnospiraceae bacterium]
MERKLKEIFDIWPPEYLLMVLIAIIIIAGIFLFFFKDILKYEREKRKIDRNYLAMAEKNRKKVKYIMCQKGMIPAIDKYKRITVFSEVLLFVPMLVFHIVSLCACFLGSYNELDYQVTILMVTPIFCMIYFFCGKKVKNYNKDMEFRAMIQGRVIEDIIFYPSAYRRPAYVEIMYEYYDPAGALHCSQQRVQIGIYFSQKKVLEKWRNLYFKGKQIDILLKYDNYRDSYVPMYENYSKEYLKWYVVHLDM